MPGKHKQLRRIDQKPALTIGGTPVSASASPAPPIVPVPEAPVLAALSTALYESAQTPAALINASWSYGGNTALISSYLVQWSTSSTFASNVNSATANATDQSISISPLVCNTTYYVRVAARVGAQSLQGPFSNTQSILTAVDTTSPSPVTSLAAAFVGTGDLLITWTNPTSANFHWAEIRIYASNGGPLYRTVYSTTGRFLYTVAMNLQDSGGAGDPSLYLDVRAQSWGAVYSTSANLSPTKSAPIAPTVTQSWSGDAGTAGADLTFTWAAISDAAYYTIALNGQTARRVNATVYTYTVDRNTADNGSPPDPTISYSIIAVDGLGQASSATTGTATNAAPAAPTATLEQGVVSGLRAAVTSAPAADFWRYEYVFKRDGTTVATVYSAGSEYRYEFTAAADVGFHSWTVVIRQEDVFAQFSSTVTPSAVAFEALTLSGLRAQARYTDSDGNTATTLAALKDGITDSGGVSYAA